MFQPVWNHVLTEGGEGEICPKLPVCPISPQKGVQLSPFTWVLGVWYHQAMLMLEQCHLISKDSQSFQRNRRKGSGMPAESYGIIKDSANWQRDAQSTCTDLSKPCSSGRTVTGRLFASKWRKTWLKEKKGHANLPFFLSHYNPGSLEPNSVQHWRCIAFLWDPSLS